MDDLLGGDDDDPPPRPRAARSVAPAPLPSDPDKLRRNNLIGLARRRAGTLIGGRGSDPGGTLWGDRVLGGGK